MRRFIFLFITIFFLTNQSLAQSRRLSIGFNETFYKNRRIQSGAVFNYSIKKFEIFGGLQFEKKQGKSSFKTILVDDNIESKDSLKYLQNTASESLPLGISLGVAVPIIKTEKWMLGWNMSYRFNYRKGKYSNYYYTTMVTTNSADPSLSFTTLNQIVSRDVSTNSKYHILSAGLNLNFTLDQFVNLRLISNVSFISFYSKINYNEIVRSGSPYSSDAYLIIKKYADEEKSKNIAFYLPLELHLMFKL